MNAGDNLGGDPFDESSLVHGEAATVVANDSSRAGGGAAELAANAARQEAASTADHSREPNKEATTGAIEIPKKPEGAEDAGGGKQAVVRASQDAKHEEMEGRRGNQRHAPSSQR